MDITFNLSLHRLRTFVKKNHLYFYTLYSKVFFQAISCGGQGKGLITKTITNLYWYYFERKNWKKIFFKAVSCLFYTVLSKVSFKAISGGGQVAGLMKTIANCIDITFDLSLHRKTTLKENFSKLSFASFTLYWARSLLKLFQVVVRLLD